MHKYLLLLAAASLALPARAQTERGAKLLGVSVGNLNYTSYADKDNSFTAAVYPSVGWFVVDRLAVGTGLPFSYSRDRTTYSGADGPVVSIARSWSYGLAPFARYYFVDASKHKLFAHLSGEITRYNNSGARRENGLTINETRYNETIKGWFAGAGYNYFLAPSVALEATLGYRRNNQYSYLSNHSRGTVDVHLGLSVFLPSGGTGTP
ncbi:outer membrane beta-barrel protein [Hymenobacter jeollabukensis]|nr:outer membrane beta-barrel protein [Hymenobacter jeollabukensis]